MEFLQIFPLSNNVFNLKFIFLSKKIEFTKTGNSPNGFCVRRGDVQTWNFALLKNFSALKPALMESLKSLAVIDIFTTDYKQ